MKCVVSPERSEVFTVLLLAVQEPLDGSLRRQKERGRERDAGQSNNEHMRMCERVSREQLEVQAHIHIVWLAVSVVMVECTLGRKSVRNHIYDRSLWLLQLEAVR